MNRWGVMLRLHRRHQFLSTIFDNLRALGQGRLTHVAVQLDRPSAAVASALETEMAKCDGTFSFDVFAAPHALLDGQEQYAAALPAQYQRLVAWGADGASLWDDDMYFRRADLKEFAGYLALLKTHRVDVRSRFLWDDTAHYNASMPEHWQAMLFQVLPGDDFTTDFTAHCPRACALSPSAAKFDAFLMNAGYLTEVDRERVFAAYRAVGKLDDFTLALVRHPSKRKLN